VGAGGCLGCEPYWTLSGSNLTANSDFNLLPHSDNADSVGSAAENWEYGYFEYMQAQQVIVGNAVTDYRFALGTVNGDTASMILQIEPGTNVMGWNGIGNYSYLNFNPITTTSYTLGTPSLYWNNVYTYSLTLGAGGCTGCGSGGSGTVTEVFTTGPITGGGFTTFGTIACPTCATISGGGALSAAFPITLGSGITGCATCLTTAGGQSIAGTDTFSQVNANVLDIISGSSTVWGSFGSNPLGGYVYLNDGSADTLMTWKTSGILSYANFYPSTSGAYSLGTPSYYWLMIYTDGLTTPTGAGVTCSGISLFTFASTNGVVTHC
jgi:hypothetical protein